MPEKETQRPERYFLLKSAEMIEGGMKSISIRLLVPVSLLFLAAKLTR